MFEWILDVKLQYNSLDKYNLMLYICQIQITQSNFNPHIWSIPIVVVDLLVTEYNYWMTNLLRQQQIITGYKFIINWNG